MTTVYVCAHKEGAKTYHDNEADAEKARARLIAHRKTEHAYVYPIQIQGDHG